MNILLQGRIAVDAQHYLQKFVDPGWNIDIWDPDTMSLSDFDELASRCHVMIGGNIPRETWPDVPELRLFQIPWAGYNHTGPEKMPQGVPVCNCFEHESSIAEYVMLGLLEWEIRLCQMDASMREHGWGGRIIGLTGSYHGELAGKTIGFVGYGHIAAAIAHRARAFGLKLKAIRRNNETCPDELEWLGGTDDLPQLLADSDYVIIACDLNAATRNLFDERVLAMMKPDSVLVNVSRGGIIDEKALYDALSQRTIAGAVIDVWYNYNEKGKPEVAPFNYPFNELDNIIMSAHESGWTENQVNRRWQFIAKNIRKIESGDGPMNVVFHGQA